MTASETATVMPLPPKVRAKDVTVANAPISPTD